MAFDLTAVIRLQDKFSGQIKRVGSNLDKFEKKTAGLRKTMLRTTAVASTAVAGAAAYSTKQFIDFERNMNEVFTLIPDASQKAMDDMTDDVHEFSREFGVLPKETVPALYQALSAGVPKDNVFEFLETAQQAAKGGVTDLSTAVDGISSVVNAYGDDVIDAQKASDNMFTAVKNGKTTFDEMSNSLYNVIPTTSSLGVEFGDVTAAIATMTAQGTPTSQATTQMRQAFVELSKEGGKASDTFKDITGSSFKEFIAEGGNVNEALGKLEEAANDMDVGVNDLFSSVEAGNAALALTGDSSEVFKKNIEDMSESAGATQEAFDKMEEGIGPAIDKITATVVTGAIEMAEEWAPHIEDMADKIEENMPQIQERVEEFGENAAEFIGKAVDKAEEFYNFIEDNWPEIKNTTLTLAGAFITLKVTLLALTIVSTITTLFRGLRTVLIATRTAMWALNTAFWANPIGFVIGLIALLIGIGVVLYKNFDTVKEKVDNLWQGMKDAWGNMVDSTKTQWYKIQTSVVDAINVVVEKINGMIETINKVPGVNVPIVPKVEAPQIPDHMAQDAGMSPMAARGPVPSNYHGLDRVPYDGYTTRLHKGERIQTAQEADAMRKGEGGKGDVNITLNYSGKAGNTKGEAKEMARLLQRELKRSWEAGA